MSKFQYHGKTGIARTKGFEHKLLAEYAVNIGNICEFGCSFCYVPSITIKQKIVQDILKQGYQIGEFSSYRYKENVLETVAHDLKSIKPKDNGTVFFCTTCDPCATKEHAEISIEAIRLIMNESNLQVRVLSKSILIKDVANALSLHRDRITFSLSTGTALPEISKAIEKNASSIKSRVEALHWLQDNKFRTYGMICPVIPSEINNVKNLVDQVRPDLCEHVWAEAINVRGKSLVNTFNCLKEAGLIGHAEELQRVMGSNDAWRKYTQQLFMNFQNELKQRNQLHKLRFLQYVTDKDRHFFEGKEGAVLL